MADKNSDADDSQNPAQNQNWPTRQDKMPCSRFDGEHAGIHFKQAYDPLLSSKTSRSRAHLKTRKSRRNLNGPAGFS